MTSVTFWMRQFLQEASLGSLVILFLIDSLVILFSGIQLTKQADRLSKVTRWGSALIGAVLLGGCTSLSGIITSVSAVVEGYPELSVSNAIGGIAAQTAFLAIADMTYKKANLEHAAASLENIMYGVVLVALLCFLLIPFYLPKILVLHIHPMSFFLILAYFYGIKLARKTSSEAMWMPQKTKETEQIVKKEIVLESKTRILVKFFIMALIIGSAGWLMSHLGIVLSQKTGLSESAVGSLLTAVATSLPELVTALTAVYRGALTLAVGDIIGGNAFDTLFVAVSDFFYTEGSIYHAMTERQIFLIVVSILLTAILTSGLIRREKHGIGNIGYESFLILVIYSGLMAYLLVN